jgi:cell division protein FtsB
LSYDIAHSGDDATIEDIARDKLGLVKPGEKIFYDIGN